MNSDKITLAAAPLHKIKDEFLEDYSVSLSVLRCDLIHPLLSGNKWYKLKYNLLRAQSEKQRTLLSFGGAWSNHLHALAAAGTLFGFHTIGLVRGELPEPLNPCLQDAADLGMRLVAVSRTAYQHKSDPAFINKLHKDFGEIYLIPEGGGNAEGVQGCMEILDDIAEAEFDLVSLACGTGTTLSGIVCNTRIPVLGFQVLKGENYLQREVERNLLQLNLKATATFSINTEYHFGGYARTSPKLMNFINRFEEKTDIPLEPVYSAKLFYGIYDLIRQGKIPSGSRVLAIHGGGLQGKRGF